MDEAWALFEQRMFSLLANAVAVAKVRVHMRTLTLMLVACALMELVMTCARRHDQRWW